MREPGRLPSIAARVTGAVAFACAVLGLAYNGLSLTSAVMGDFEQLARDDALAYFYSAFYVMSGFCILCYLVLLWCAVQLLRGRFTVALLFAAVSGVEILYALALRPITQYHPEAGLSIAAASGVSSGGLMAQFVVLLPLWGPAVAIWANRRVPKVAT